MHPSRLFVMTGLLSLLAFSTRGGAQDADTTTVSPSEPEANAATAAPRRDAAPEGQENFGVGAQIGFFNPEGLALRAGARAISLEAAGGFVPILLSYGDRTAPTLRLLFPAEATGQIIVHALTLGNDVRGALRMGYRYNAMLGHGATLGAQVAKRFGAHLQLEAMGGVSVYPDATNQLRGSEVSASEHFNYPPELGGGVTVGLMFFP